jgi:hypothetical protein
VKIFVNFVVEFYHEEHKEYTKDTKSKTPVIDEAEYRFPLSREWRKFGLCNPSWKKMCQFIEVFLLLRLFVRVDCQFRQFSETFPAMRKKLKMPTLTVRWVMTGTSPPIGTF